MSIFFPPRVEVDLSEPPPPPPLRRRRGLRRILAVIAALLVVVVAGTAIYAGVVSSAFENTVQRESLLPDDVPAADTAADGEDSESRPQRPEKRVTGARNYVLMGSDTRDPQAEQGRSDSLMVLHLSEDRRSAYLISFPRDMYVPIPGYGRNKINAAYSFGGPKLTVQTLEQLLDTRIDHVAMIDFEGFIALTEELGGVTVHNRHATKSRGYTFKRGEITISGDEALAFVRERYDLPNGDLDRAERQRSVVKAILRKGLSPEVMANPTRFTEFVGELGRHLTVDDELSDTEIRKTAVSLRLSPNELVLLQAPIAGFGSVNGASIDIVDQPAMADLSEALASDTLDDYLDKHGER